MSALLLCVALLAPAPTLGQALRAAGAFQDPAPAATIPTEALPPDPERAAPPRYGARALLLVGGALIAAGILGSIATPGCDTRDADGACVAVSGSASAFPALIAIGLGATVAGSWWWQQVLPDWEH